jgi:hypothetical protein
MQRELFSARIVMQLKLLPVKLQNAAGNFYINDKPTGAVVDNNHSVAQERLEQTTKQVLH